MVRSRPFVSYAQNREDVVLQRVLGHISKGRYVDVGANHPVDDSVTWAFYEQGWRGLLVDPNPEFAVQLREQRPGDVVAEVAVSDTPGTIILHAIAGTGLSTVVDEVGSRHAAAGLAVDDIEVPTAGLSDLLDQNGLGEGELHFMSIDTEGSEGQVIATIDFARHRPWVMVVESTAPNSTRQVFEEWEPALLAAGYEFRLFDGLSRFYVAREHADELGDSLSYPACVFDDYRLRREVDAAQATAELAATAESLAKARTQALAELEEERARAAAELERVRAEAAAARRTLRAKLRRARYAARRAEAEVAGLRASTSWRMTAPLRALRGATRRR